MIWGETTEQRNARLNNVEPKPWFAWYPVTLKDGRWAWLSMISRHRYAGYDYWFYDTALAQQPKGHGGGDD